MLNPFIGDGSGDQTASPSTSRASTKQATENDFQSQLGSEIIGKSVSPDELPPHLKSMLIR